MFKSSTVLVIGAGASAEAELPIGSLLKTKISDLTRCKFEWGQFRTGNGDFIGPIVHSSHFGGDTNRVARACTKISNGIGFVSSVDNFLEIHADDADVQFCAKCAIVYLISEGERGSPQLRVDTSNIYNTLRSSALDGTWYQALAQILFEKVSASSLGKAFEPISFVSFNYDRCLEWFLFQCLMSLYAISSQDALSILRNVNIWHPYGQIGSADWTANPDCLFANDLLNQMEHVSKNIRTYSEGSTSETVDAIQKAVGSAENLIFLGFAFHPQNMSVLQSEVDMDYAVSKNIYFTCSGMSANDSSQIAIELESFFTRYRGGGYTKSKVIAADLKCSEFMQRYKRTLAA